MNTFKRYEIKYQITTKQLKKLMKLVSEYMVEDEYGESTICNLYYDTPDYLLIRRSIEKPVYKEKLRVRSYGVAQSDDLVFVELKKKYKSVVYKRRIKLVEAEVEDFFETDQPHATQIAKEIDYFKFIYPNISPKMYICYDRVAYYGKSDNEFRMTFDKNIMWRDTDLSLTSKPYGNQVLKSNLNLMEIKVSGGIPLWLSHFLAENKIYKTSFSKYGTAYTQMLQLNRMEIS